MDRKKVTREDLRHLGRQKVLSTSDLARTLGVSQVRASQWARALKRRGLLTAIERGLYAVVPLEVDPRGFVADPYLAVDRALRGEHAFSHWSALALFGAEHHVRTDIHVVRPGGRSRLLHVGTVRVHVHAIPPRSWTQAVRRVKRAGASVWVTTPERTALDLASSPNSQVEYGDLATAIADLRAKMDARVILSELARTPRRTAPARLLHLLTRDGASPFFSKGDSDRLSERYSLKSPGYLGTRPHNPANRLDVRWNVIYPGRD